MTEEVEFRFKSPNDSSGYLLAHLTMLWQRKQKKVLDSLDLTHTQFLLLASLGWLSRENNAVTQVKTFSSIAWNKPNKSLSIIHWVHSSNMIPM